MFLSGLLRLQDRTRTEAVAISLTAGVHFFKGLLVFMLVIQVNAPGDTAATVISSWKQAQEAKILQSHQRFSTRDGNLNLKYLAGWLYGTVRSEEVFFHL